MAAIAYPMTDLWTEGRPADGYWPARADQSNARVYRLDTGRCPPGARVYRRRRAVALLILVTVALVAVTGVQLALADAGGGALTASGSARASSSTGSTGRIYVVQPGDSVWSIVEATSRGSDPRPEVDRLIAQLGGQPLQPGDRLRLP